jgi:hypothetical protein
MASPPALRDSRLGDLSAAPPSATGEQARRRHGSLLAIAAGAMLLGGLLYVAYRPTSLLMFDWFEAIGLGPAVASLRIAASELPPPPTWAIGSLPYALWLLSGLLVLAWIWQGVQGAAPLVWMGLLAAIAIGGEIGQWLGAVPGTFDPIDLSLVIAACTAALPLLVLRRLQGTP